MKKFRFRLEKVLRYREGEERQILAELRTALARVHEAEDELEGLIGRRKESEDLLLKEQTAPSMDVRRILNVQEGLLRLDEGIRKAGLRLASMRKVAEVIRARLKAARMKTESLNRVKEKKLERHAAQARTEEMKGLDEVAVARHMRRGASDRRS